MNDTTIINELRSKVAGLQAELDKLRCNVQLVDGVIRPVPWPGETTLEPMNLRLFTIDETWCIRGFGAAASDVTPDLALRKLVRVLNDSLDPKWPVSGEPLLSCVDCRNTESPAGAMARYFNRGRCLHCGGWFKVVRA